MTVAEVKVANQALLDTVARLVDELDEVPAGRVLRCFSRAVGHVRRVGCPTTQLATEAEWLARELLAGRLVLDSTHGPEPQTPQACVRIHA
ncbi:hypothetical protein JCM18899A_41010 [Nocardioides sp. AN3]